MQSFAWVMLGLFLAGAGLGVREVVYADPQLQLKQIHAVPPDTLSVAKIESLQKRYLGKNTAQINLKEIAKALEEDHQILKADVRRVLPDRLEVHVDRRIPFAYVQFGRGGKWGLVSRDAVVLDVVTQPSRGLYAVENDTLINQKPKIGMRLSKNMLQLVRVIDSFLKHPVSQSEKVESVAMLPNDAAILKLQDLSLKVNLNDLAPEQAFNKFQYLLETESRAMIEYVDLRFNRVILKRKTEAVERESKRR